MMSVGSALAVRDLVEVVAERLLAFGCAVTGCARSLGPIGRDTGACVAVVLVAVVPCASEAVLVDLDLAVVASVVVDAVSGVLPVRFPKGRLPLRITHRKIAPIKARNIVTYSRTTLK